jgi:hypothetical protein
VGFGEAGDQGEADADPGGVGRCAGPWRKGSHRVACSSRGDADAGVFDGEQDPLAAAGELDPHRGVGGGVAAGVGEQVLDDALDLGRVHPGDHRLGQHLQLPAAAQPPLLAIRAMRAPRGVCTSE